MALRGYSPPFGARNFQYGSPIPRRSLASAPSPTKAEVPEVLEVLESNDPEPRITLQDVNPVHAAGASD
ncbi:hypothetical protein F53441_1477 [Fusarium austroafricanum]|uniref:Uncharacterized protein n=1 Tax=Fusarium austroafricanum TaxID=2364996 RepID=A0A8H4PD84_9HYPO|nr:hypothetical protein F53441_1477 [Fusarium austroafricanum]